MNAVDVEQFSDRWLEIRERITAAGGTGVDVVGVTKTFGVEAIAALRSVGGHRIGESYAQEMLAKFSAADPTLRPAMEVHFIGGIQSNKIRQIAPLVDVYDSVDRTSVIDELARRVPGARLLIQVDPLGQTGKSGCGSGEVDGLVADAIGRGLCVEGLMTVGPTDGDPGVTRSVFRSVRQMVDRLGLAVCSMGMSADLEIAIGEGATQVRIGSALFGSRPRRR